MNLYSAELPVDLYKHCPSATLFSSSVLQLFQIQWCGFLFLCHICLVNSAHNSSLLRYFESYFVSQCICYSTQLYVSHKFWQVYFLYLCPRHWWKYWIGWRLESESSLETFFKIASDSFIRNFWSQFIKWITDSCH